MENTQFKNRVMINDGLREMAANAVEIFVDNATGRVYATYLSSDKSIGESSQLIKLAKFPVLQPTNVEWVTVFSDEDDFSGHCLSECNLIELNTETLRVFAVDVATWTYYYKDVDKKTFKVGDIHPVYFKFHDEAAPVALSLENVNTFLKEKGFGLFESLNMTSSMTKVDGHYYSVLCGGNTNGPVFVKTEDGDTWTCNSVIPHRANYEAMLCYHNGKFWVFCRDAFTEETEETRQNLLYSEDGVNWTQSTLALTPSDTRPYLFTYQGDLYLAYSSPKAKSYSTVRTWRCNLHVGKIVSEGGKETFEEIIYKESKFGIVYYALMDWNGKMIMLYSSGELHPTEGLIDGWSQGKDCLSYTVLHTQEPELSFEK